MPPAESIEQFLDGVPPDKCRALQHLRDEIRRLVPEATESISYGVPAFKLGGRPLVSFGAARDHCTFYVQSPAVIEAFAQDLAGFRLSKGSVQFSPERPIPADLVRRLVEARIAEVRGPVSRQ
jgi:uncharacterized protein YdhG (YjbR/CyaY superfamily)